MIFANKVVIVTGSSSGIGAATAKEFAKEGADVVLVDRQNSNISENISKLGKKPLVITADISKDDEMKRIINETIKTYGKLDVLVNNAGLIRNGSILDGQILQSYDETMATNIRAVVHLTSLAAPHLIKTKGNIVNIASVAGSMVISVPTLAMYSVSKAAVSHFTRGAALELAKHGVRVNGICPGPVQTAITKTANADFTIEDLARASALKRASQPIEIADLILFLASDKSIGITGSNFVADNGIMLGSV